MEHLNISPCLGLPPTHDTASQAQHPSCQTTLQNTTLQLGDRLTSFRPLRFCRSQHAQPSLNRRRVIDSPTPRRVPASASSTSFLAGSTSRHPSLRIRHLRFHPHTHRKRIPNTLHAQEPNVGLRYLTGLFPEVSGTATIRCLPLGAETSAFPQERVLEAGLHAVTRQEKRTELWISSPSGTSCKRQRNPTCRVYKHPGGLPPRPKRKRR